VNLRSRKLQFTGGTLIVIALMVMATAAMYVWLAPPTYSAHVRVMIRPASAVAAPVRLQDLPLDSFKEDRNLRIENPRGSSLFEITAFASTPEAAVDLVSKHLREFEANVRSQLKADVSIIELAEANPHPVRPNRKAIFTISGITALNVAFVGVVLFVTGLLQSRRLSGAQATPDQLTA
jgi:capsular polysaccharide biosynthesis protein